MRKSWLQLYAPFLVLALVQALLIVVAPSRGEGSSNLSAGSALDGSQAPLDLDGDGLADPSTGDASTTDGGTTDGGTGGTTGNRAGSSRTRIRARWDRSP